jgi:hypothetical protein
MLWARANAARSQYVNLSQRVGDGGYFEFWFYDDDTYGRPSRMIVEFRAYALPGHRSLAWHDAAVHSVHRTV